MFILQCLAPTGAWIDLCYCESQMAGIQILMAIEGEGPYRVVSNEGIEASKGLAARRTA